VLRCDAKSAMSYSERSQESASSVFKGSRDSSSERLIAMSGWSTSCELRAPVGKRSALPLEGKALPYERTCGERGAVANFVPGKRYGGMIPNLSSARPAWIAQPNYVTIIVIYMVFNINYKYFVMLLIHYIV
jgi:hypothetical protein